MKCKRTLAFFDPNHAGDGKTRPYHSLPAALRQGVPRRTGGPWLRRARPPASGLRPWPEIEQSATLRGAPASRGVDRPPGRPPPSLRCAALYERQGEALALSERPPGLRRSKPSTPPTHRACLLGDLAVPPDSSE